MKRTPGAGGRTPRVSTGTGRAYRRGSGLGTGPVGSGGRPSASQGGSSSGDRAGGRSTGGGLLLGLLLGKLLSGGGGGGNGGGRKGGCLKRIVLLILVLFVLYMLVRCVAGGMGGFSDILGGYADTGYEDGDTGFDEPVVTPAPSTAATAAVAADTTVSNLAREKRTQIKGNGQDVHTIMVYMCGTDLESKYGMATADINEMLHATISDNINLIVETGGTKTWKNSVVSNSTNQYYQIKNDGIVRLKSDVGKKSMVKAETLTEFIDFCEKNFPANRYSLIMWDHGGGSNTGYGYDQNFPSGSMTLDVFNAALKNAGCAFDFIGFDACLMATLETALVCEPYADYLIASEEPEPGTGWYYTDWLTKLSENTSMSTVELGKCIIDDFTVACKQSAPSNKTTLSIIDLAELIGTVPEAFNDFASSTRALIDSSDYEVVSNARSGAKEFSSGINQVDLIDFAEKMDTPEAAALVDALRGCIKYNRVSKALAGANGISIYFPYDSLSSMKSMVSTYEKIGMDSAYTECIRSFAGIATGGQLVSSSSGSPLSSLFGEMTGSGNTSDMLGSLLSSYMSGSGSSASSSSAGSYAELLSMLSGGASSWLDTGRVLESEGYYAENSLDNSRLVWADKNGARVLQLSDDEWDLIQTVELNVYADDGEGYIDLGLDNRYFFDDDLDLVMDYDGSWLAINGQPVAYYMTDENIDGGEYVITGRVPAMLNGELVDIIITFSDENPDGTILGARKVYDPSETETVMKGLIDIKDGDEIDFLCDYYGYDGAYSDTYYLGEKLTVAGPLAVSNISLGDMALSATYRLTDIYGSHYWTEAVKY